MGSFIIDPVPLSGAPVFRPVHESFFGIVQAKFRRFAEVGSAGSGVFRYRIISTAAPSKSPRSDKCSRFAQALGIPIRVKKLRSPLPAAFPGSTSQISLKNFGLALLSPM